MASVSMKQRPHRRFNPLAREWVLVSPHRVQRPWQGSVEKEAQKELKAYDPECYLCPGNLRAEPPGGGERPRNPEYRGTFVFQNDFSALLPDAPVVGPGAAAPPLFRARPERGVCRVVIFSPRHNLTLPEMPVGDIRAVVDVWAEQYAELAALPYVNHVQIFENKGEIMGCSNPHPHGQIWSQESIPDGPAKEIASLTDYREAHGGACLLCDYLAEEMRQGERLVCSNRHFTALVPFWAVWPFETMILSHRHAGAIADFDGAERDALADILRRLTTRYDNVFETSFPYSMGIHQAPTDGGEHAECHFHMHFFPPLLRSAKVKKFMVGYEMLGEPQRDITAEASADRLRSMSETHWKAGG